MARGHRRAAAHLMEMGVEENAVTLCGHSPQSIDRPTLRCYFAPREGSGVASSIPAGGPDTDTRPCFPPASPGASRAEHSSA